LQCRGEAWIQGCGIGVPQTTQIHRERDQARKKRNAVKTKECVENVQNTVGGKKGDRKKKNPKPPYRKEKRRPRLSQPASCGGVGTSGHGAKRKGTKTTSAEAVWAQPDGLYNGAQPK